MDKQISLWVLAGAVGLLTYNFTSLLCWDVLKYIPFPGGPSVRNANELKNAKWHFKFWSFLAGCGSTVGLFSLAQDSYPKLIFLALLGGFSAPIAACFTLRVLLALGLGIFLLYQRTELIYEACKAWLVSVYLWCKKRLTDYLRKKGRIE
jgi:hypothetical protein